MDQIPLTGGCVILAEFWFPNNEIDSWIFHQRLNNAFSEPFEIIYKEL